MIPLPEPFDYCYEWDGPWGTRKFSPNSYNGRRCDRSVALYTADQMHAHAAAARRQALEEAAQAVLDIEGDGGTASVALYQAEYAIRSLIDKDTAT